MRQWLDAFSVTGAVAWNRKESTIMDNIGRNDPCPCGSGKKYKKCCLPKETRSLRSTLAEEPAEETFIAELLPELDEAVDRLLERLELGERAGMEKEFQALLQENPNYHLTNYAMGVYVAMAEQDPVRAIPFFEKAIRIFRYLPEAHFNLGNCHFKAAHVAEAAASYRQAIRYSNAEDGISAMAKKELRALERIVLETSPFASFDDYIENQKLFNLAFENLKNQQYEEALELFQKVLDQNPRHPQSYGNLGLAHAGLGHKAAALECLDKALEIDASYQPARLNRKLIETMTEGVPNIPSIFAETEYYRDSLEETKSKGGSWWDKVKVWERG